MVTTQKDHYIGHRERLRTKFLASESAIVPDYELLELLLCYVHKRKDVKSIAKELLRVFKNINGVIGAEIQHLSSVQGIGTQAIVLFKVLHELTCRSLLDELRAEPILNNLDKTIAYCRARMAFLKAEQSRILFLNSKNYLITDELHQYGTINTSAMYPRDIIHRALSLGATAIILVHNHPSGDPTPSEQDIRFTKHIQEASRLLQVVIHDHIIIGRNGYCSMRKHGIL